VIALVFHITPEVCLARNAGRTSRVVTESVVRRQWDRLRQSREFMDSEGYAGIYDIDQNMIDVVRIVRTRS
jgi:predicted kinase